MIASGPLSHLSQRTRSALRMLLSADVVSRLVVPPSELPLGVLTTLMGAPVLIAVVRARRLPTL